jgi:hypothetical protein
LLSSKRIKFVTIKPENSMNKYLLIFTVALISCLGYFILHANAQTAATHEYMVLKTNAYDLNKMYVSTSEGKFEVVKLKDPVDKFDDCSQFLLKVKEYENAGWHVKTFTFCGAGLGSFGAAGALNIPTYVVYLEK